jgi:acetyltransferase-like isoleucine patch superfamily enzyme
VGAGSYVDPSVQIVGWENVRVGTSSTISQDTWLNVNFRDEGSVRISIGNSCHVGRRNFLSSGPLIKLDDYFFSGIDCRFLGSGHETGSPMKPYLASGLSAGAPIDIGVNCWLTTGVTVLQGVSIGRGSVIGAGSIVARSLPPFSLAYGQPCMPVRRFSFKDNQWVNATSYRDSDDSYAPDETAYREALQKAAGQLPLALIAASSRFGWI